MFALLLMLSWIVGVSLIGQSSWLPLQTYASAFYLFTILLIVLGYLIQRFRLSLFFQFLLKSMVLISITLLGQNYANHALEQRLAQRYTHSDSIEKIVFIHKISNRLSSESSRPIQQPALIVNSDTKQQKQVMLSLNHEQAEMTLGQYYAIKGIVKPAHSYAIPYTFDTEKWQVQQNIAATIRVNNLEAIDQNIVMRSGNQSFITTQNHFLNRLKIMVEQQRLNFRNWIHRQPLKQKGLLLALLSGDESLLNDDTKLLFKQLGISHLLAISGPHVLIFAGLMSVLFSFMITRFFPSVFQRVPRPYLLVIPFCFCVIAYTAFVGFEIPALRTCLTVVLLSLILLCKQRVQALYVVVASAAILLLIDPFSVLSAAFWLSYVACFVLMRVYQTIVAQKNHIDALKTQNTLHKFKQEIVIYSKALIESQWKIFIALLPLTLLIFQQVSIISPWVNLISIPLIGGLIVPLEVVGAILSLIFEPLGLLFFHIADLLLSGLLKVFAILDVMIHPELQWWALSQIQIICIACAIFILFLPYKVVPKAWAGVCLLPIVLPHHSSELFKLNVLDVGQGQAIHLQVDDKNILFDTGGYYDEQKFSVAERLIIPYLKAQGIQQIDQVILSHLDQDHAGAFSKIAQFHDIKAVYSNERDARFKDMDFHYCYAGQSWQFKDVKISVLSPSKNELEHVVQDQNEYSCVVYIEVQSAENLKHYLVMGDAGWQTEYQLLQQYPDLKVDVLILGHHGSQHSSSYDFLKRLNPQLAIASAGYNNRYHHPHKVTKARLDALHIPLLTTIDSGSIQFRLNADGKIQRLDQRDQKSWLKPISVTVLKSIP